MRDLSQCANDELTARAGAAIMLAEFFWTPVPEWKIESWRVEGKPSFLAEYCSLLGLGVCESIVSIEDDLRSGSVADVERRLNVDSTRLFRTGHDEAPAPPYGSVWIEPEGLLMGRTTRSVASTYREHGLGVSEGKSDTVPDHIARELEFLAFVFRTLGREASGPDGGDSGMHESTAAEFLSAYCLPWWRTFSSVVAQNAETEFFRSAAHVLGAFAGHLEDAYQPAGLGSLATP